MVKIENKELSIADLVKGDYISQEVIRHITGYDPRENVDLYRLATLKLRERINRERGFETQGAGDAIRVLVDSENVFYQQKRRERGKRQLRKALARGNEIDENNLDEPTLARHRRNQLNASRELTALDTEARRIRAEDKQQYKAPGAMPPSRIMFVSSQGENKQDGSKTTDSEVNGILAVDSAQRIDGESATSLCQANEEVDQQEEQDG